MFDRIGCWEPDCADDAPGASTTTSFGITDTRNQVFQLKESFYPPDKVSSQSNLVCRALKTWFLKRSHVVVLGWPPSLCFFLHLGQSSGDSSDGPAAGAAEGALADVKGAHDVAVQFSQYVAIVQYDVLVPLPSGGRELRARWL